MQNVKKVFLILSIFSVFTMAGHVHASDRQGSSQEVAPAAQVDVAATEAAPARKIRVVLRNYSRKVVAYTAVNPLGELFGIPPQNRAISRAAQFFTTAFGNAFPTIAPEESIVVSLVEGQTLAYYRIDPERTASNLTTVVAYGTAAAAAASVAVPAVATALVSSTAAAGGGAAAAGGGAAASAAIATATPAAGGASLLNPASLVAFLAGAKALMNSIRSWVNPAFTWVTDNWPGDRHLSPLVDGQVVIVTDADVRRGTISCGEFYGPQHPNDFAGARQE
jgi:hypothetical protein